MFGSAEGKARSAAGHRRDAAAAARSRPGVPPTRCGCGPRSPVHKPPRGPSRHQAWAGRADRPRIRGADAAAPATAPACIRALELRFGRAGRGGICSGGHRSRLAPAHPDAGHVPPGLAEHAGAAGGDPARWSRGPAALADWDELLAAHDRPRGRASARCGRPSAPALPLSSKKWEPVFASGKRSRYSTTIFRAAASRDAARKWMNRFPAKVGTGFCVRKAVQTVQ